MVTGDFLLLCLLLLPILHLPGVCEGGHGGQQQQLSSGGLPDLLISGAGILHLSALTTRSLVPLAGEAKFGSGAGPGVGGEGGGCH